jgi:hypothetical protein
MKMTAVSTASLLVAMTIVACGGGDEKSTPRMEHPQMQIQQGPTASTTVWESLPLFPGARPTDARMMPGRPPYQKFEVRVFNAPEDAKTIVDFFKKEMPEQEWVFVEETKIDKGLQGHWESKTDEGTLWVRATENQDAGGTDIEIIWGKKQG